MNSTSTLEDSAHSAQSRVFGCAELLSDIFMHRVLDDYDIPSPRKAPLTLGHVSRHWRTIAFGSSLLWSQAYFHIDPDVGIAPSLLQGYVSAITFWLIQSGQSLLDFNLVVKYPHEQDFRTIDLQADYERHILDLMVIFIDHRDRWRNIALTLPPFVSKIFCGPTLSFPNLEAFYLCHSYGRRWNHDNSNELPMVFPLVLPGAFLPTLRQLSLADTTLRCEGSSQVIQLRKLSLRNVRIPYNHFAMLPALFPLLEKLSVTIRAPHHIANGPFITFDNLRSLTSVSEKGVPLNIITAPALEYLSITWSPDKFSHDIDGTQIFNGNLLAFLRRSSPPLKAFSYSSGYLRDSMDPILQEIQGISELKINHAHLPSDALQMLFRASFFSDLRKLSIYNSLSYYNMHEAITADGMLEFLLERGSGDCKTCPVKLESLDVCMHEGEYQKMCSLRQLSLHKMLPRMTIRNMHVCDESLCRRHN